MRTRRASWPCHTPLLLLRPTAPRVTPSRMQHGAAGCVHVGGQFLAQPARPVCICICTCHFTAVVLHVPHMHPCLQTSMHAQHDPDASTREVARNECAGFNSPTLFLRASTPKNTFPDAPNASTMYTHSHSHVPSMARGGQHRCDDGWQQHGGCNERAREHARARLPGCKDART